MTYPCSAKTPSRRLPVQSGDMRSRSGIPRGAVAETPELWNGEWFVNRLVRGAARSRCEPTRRVWLTEALTMRVVGAFAISAPGMGTDLEVQVLP